MAQDSGGLDAADPFYERAKAEFTCLIDIEHRVTSLYGMINVPSGVWIDEEGRILRPPEVAYSRQKIFGSIVAGDDEYAQALRDWVGKGGESEYLLQAEEISWQMRSRNPQRPAADAHFRLAVWLHRNGSFEAAARHWQRAQELDPENWNYHRQQWSFDPETASAKFRAKYRALGDRPYYPPAELKKK
ncbi:MAG: hypothetical protein ACYTG5_05990 [Planctomycetota bacterium]